MALPLTIAIFVSLLFLLLASGVYIGLGLAGVGIFGLEFLANLPGIIGNSIFNALHSYVLAAIPLFVFMGELVFRSGISHRLYSGVSRWTRIMPGGLLHSNILSCSLFAAISGSSTATAATIGSVAYPEQSARGYNRALVTGSLAAGGTLGILIPPSITMIIYGAFVNVSVGQLFMGGVVPGIILALLFMIYIAMRSTISPALVEPRENIRPSYLLEGIAASKDIWPVLLIMFTIFGGIYGGVFTPTEAAAVSCFEALVLAAIFGKLKFRLVKDAALGALRTTAMVMIIIVGAQIMGNAISMMKVPARLAELLAGWDVSSLVVWFGIVVLYLMLGCILEGLAMMLLTLPVTFPLVVTTLGFDPVWFGVLLVVLIEAGLMTPPVGLNVYIIHAISGGTNIMEVFKGVFPFFVCMVLVVVLLTFFPKLVLWLPSVMLG